MPRTLLTATATVALLLTAACGTTTETPSATGSSAAVTASPSIANNTKEICAQLDSKSKPVIDKASLAIVGWLQAKKSGDAKMTQVVENGLKGDLTAFATSIESLASQASERDLQTGLQEMAGKVKALSDLKTLDSTKTFEQNLPALTAALAVPAACQ